MRPTLETRASETLVVESTATAVVPATTARATVATPMPTTTRPAATVPIPARPTSPTTTPVATDTAPAPKPESTFVPARSWAWAPSANARAYTVTFYLDGRVVLRAQATHARFLLPRSFRYRPGTYRWTVETVPASAGQPIVDSTFVVTAATAAAANR